MAITGVTYQDLSCALDDVFQFGTYLIFFCANVTYKSVAWLFNNETIANCHELDCAALSFAQDFIAPETVQENGRTKYLLKLSNVITLALNDPDNRRISGWNGTIQELCSNYFKNSTSNNCPDYDCNYYTAPVVYVPIIILLIFIIVVGCLCIWQRKSLKKAESTIERQNTELFDLKRQKSEKDAIISQQNTTILNLNGKINALKSKNLHDPNTTPVNLTPANDSEDPPPSLCSINVEQRTSTIVMRSHGVVSTLASVLESSNGLNNGQRETSISVFETTTTEQQHEHGNASSELQPILSSELQPILSSELQPILSSELQPILSSRSQFIVTQRHEDDYVPITNVTLPQFK